MMGRRRIPQVLGARNVVDKALGRRAVAVVSCFLEQPQQNNRQLRIAGETDVAREILPIRRKFGRNPAVRGVKPLQRVRTANNALEVVLRAEDIVDLQKALQNVCDAMCVGIAARLKALFAVACRVLLITRPAGVCQAGFYEAALPD